MAQRDLLVVVNAAAGSGRQEPVDAAMAVLRRSAGQAGARVDLISTADLPALRDALEDLAGRQLVVLGGDGSVHAAVQCLRESGRLQAVGPVGIVPLGTGNDLARSLGLPADAAEAARVVMTGTARPMELLVSDDGLVAVNAVHVGLGAAAAARAAAVKARLRTVRLGRLAYPVGAVAAGLTSSGWRLRVEVDGTVVHDGREPVLMVALGAGGTVGGGAPLVPGADPHDGLVDVVVSLAVGPLARLRHALQLRTGSHVRRSDVLTCRGRTVRLSAAPGESFPEDCDGEVHEPSTTRRWDVEPDAWQVVVPATAAG